MYKKFISSVLILIFLIVYQSTVSAATVSLLSWNLVDSGKHLDWDQDTKYLSYFKSGVTVWNDYKSGVIREDSFFVIEDVFVSDYNEVSNTAGVTSSSGTIKYNDFQMNMLTSSERKNVSIHEIGHALGLDHNTSSDVMYKYVSSKTTLSTNDKASYNAAYNNY